MAGEVTFTPTKKKKKNQIKSNQNKTGEWKHVRGALMLIEERKERDETRGPEMTNTLCGKHTRQYNIGVKI